MKKILKSMKMKKLLRAVLAVSTCFVLVINVCMFASAEDTTEPTLTLDTESYFVRSAAVRLADTVHDSGVRFKTVITKDVFETQFLEENGDMKSSVKTYTVLIPSGNLSGDLTAETTGAKVIETTGIWKEVEYDGTGYYESTVYVYNIPRANYGSDITVRSYVQYGEEAPIYTAAKSASMAYVADAAVNSSGSTLTDEQKASLKGTYLTYKLTYTMGGERIEETIYYKDDLTDYLPSGVLVWTNTAGTAVWNLQNTVSGDMKLTTQYTEGLSGAGTEGEPFIIDSKADLEQLAVACTNGITFYKKYFRLGADNLTADTQISVHTSSSTGGFRGTFDGNSYTITADITGETYVGLFGAIGSGGLVKNLTVAGSVTSTLENENHSGAVAGMVYGKIQNCTNKAAVTGYSDIGGIAGRTWGGSVIDGCINEGTVTVNGTIFSGGIVGYMFDKSTVENCENKGSVSGISSVGGIAGYVGGNADAKSNTTVLSGNVNNGTVTGTSYRVGGIVGCSTSMVLIDSCTNNGSVSGVGNTKNGEGGVGGIAGAVYDTDITGCVNGEKAVITNSGTATGGIVGYINKNGVEIKDCNNYAAITEEGAYVGGVVGYTANDTVIDNCKNYGEIKTDSNSSGGIAGFMSVASTVQNCENTVSGSVSGTYQVGGIAGRIDGDGNASENTTKLLNNVNNGMVTGSSYRVGGIVGLTTSGILIDGCTNNGKVTGMGNITSGQGGIGGIAGSIFDTDITNCNNGKDAVIQNTGSATGGIVGYIDKDGVEITGCSNAAAITEEGAYVGGIVGYTEHDTVIKDCKNTGNINTSSYSCGGIAGSMISGGTIESCNNTGAVLGKGSSTTGGVGGIAGTMYASTVQLCENSGTISNNGTVTGGIVGLIYKSDYSDGNATINQCKNFTSIETSTAYVGGIVGHANVRNNIVVEILYCENGSESSDVDIIGKSYTGGIIGNLGTVSADSTHKIIGCKNYGNITATNYFSAKTVRVGGIAGMSYAPIDGCFSRGVVTSSYYNVTASEASGTTDNYHVGIIVGYKTNACKLTDCTFY